MQTYQLSALDDGERVVSERLDGVRSAAIGFWIDAGSRDEDAAKAGASHLLEHLLFKGTRAYSAQEIAEIFDGLGGELKAATTREYTVVYARIMDEHVETALDVMTDMVFTPTLVDLDSEREVVLEEIAMYEDAPQETVHDLITQATFGNHPLGRPVIGTADAISSISPGMFSESDRGANMPSTSPFLAAAIVARASSSVRTGRSTRMRPSWRAASRWAPSFERASGFVAS